mmetsp:Transcript_15599/g.10967  ORF Transcript_15599/g.10967 Transcript_15599/m.10967 type:complete len:227 (+) Transcript_15599:517-1197(+)
MSVSGPLIKHRAKVNLSILMVTFMKVNGIITKPMERESIPMSRELAMKETGKMINNTEKVLKLGLRAQAMKACTYSQRKRDLESTRGLMVLPTKVIGSITKSMAMELIYGLTDVSIMANGLPMTCKVLEYTSIKTVSDTMVNTKMTKKKATVYTTGLMVGSTKAGGPRASSTASAYTSILIKSLLNMVYGSMVREPPGLMTRQFSQSIKVDTILNRISKIQRVHNT